MTSPSRLPTRGAFDLSRLATPKQPAQAGGAGAATSLVIDVTEATFDADVIQQSMTVPVVVDFWAEWCEPCKQLSPVLEKLAGEYAGRFVLAAIDVDTNQSLATAAGVQGIPMVIGVIGGQAVPLFNGAVPEAEVRRYLDELLRVAAANGVSGVAAPPVGDPAVAQAPKPPDRNAEAFELLRIGDLAGAGAAYRAILDTTPGDAEARTGLARVELIERVSALDAERVRAAAASGPDDVASQLDAADLDVAEGRIEAGFARLVDTIRRVTGAERDMTRAHLLRLFEVAGPADPRVAAARTALANALF